MRFPTTTTIFDHDYNLFSIKNKIKRLYKVQWGKDFKNNNKPI